MASFPVRASDRRHTTVLNTRQMGDVPFPGGQIRQAELVEMIVSTSAGQDLHKLRGRAEEIGQTLGADGDIETPTQLSGAVKRRHK